MSVLDTSSAGPKSEVTDEHFFDAACDEINRIHAEYLSGLLELNDDQRMIFDEIGRMLLTYRFGDGDPRQARLIDVSRQMRELLSADEATTVIPVFVANIEPEAPAPVAAPAAPQPVPVAASPASEPAPVAASVEAADNADREVPIRALPSLKTPDDVAALDQRTDARRAPTHRYLPVPDAPGAPSPAPTGVAESAPVEAARSPEVVATPAPAPAAPVASAPAPASSLAPAPAPAPAADDKKSRRPSRLPAIAIAGLVGICGGLGYTTYKDMNSVAKWKSADSAQVAYQTQIEPDLVTVEKDLSGVGSEVKSLNSAVTVLQTHVPADDHQFAQLHEMTTAADDVAVGLEQCVASTIGLQTGFADSLASGSASTVQGFATAVAHVESTCDTAVKDDQILQADLPSGS